MARQAPIVICLAMLGCGSTQAIVAGRLEPYSGVRVDLWMLSYPNELPSKVLMAIDIPPSAILDTVLLPLTVPMALMDASSEEDEAASCACLAAGSARASGPVSQTRSR